jgi:hypothetical protein
MDQNLNPIGIAYVAAPQTRAQLQASHDAQDRGEHISMNFPLRTSPLEDMMKVLPANRPQ